MDVYVYCADIYCADCGERFKDTADCGDVADSGDSDEYPQGPYPDGGGEADSPQHCGCGSDCLNAIEVDGHKVGAFLENPLTTDGIDYVRGFPPTTELSRMWREFYGIL